MDIEVKKIVGGDSGITLQDGQQLYDVIHPALRSGEAVRIDFSGVDIIASPFLNAAIGHLLEDISPDDLNRLLQIDGMPPAGMNTLRHVIANAKRYYSDPTIRQAVDRAIREEAEAL